MHLTLCHVPFCRRKSAEAAAAAEELKRKQEEDRKQKYLALRVRVHAGVNFTLRKRFAILVK